MELVDLPVRDPRESISGERRDLLDLLTDFSDDEWLAPTEAGHWRVKDVALHLLDDDLGWLSRGRDGDMSGLLPTEGDYRQFVGSLDAKNERWIVGAGGLSRRVVIDLLRWSGHAVDEFHASVDLDEASAVIWASNDSVPRWFDLCRDLTERWVHQQHIRDAVGQPGTHQRLLPDVLSTFVWAFPHQFDAEAPDGTVVQVGFDVAGTWHLIRSGHRWTLEPGTAPAPPRAWTSRRRSPGGSSPASRCPRMRCTWRALTISWSRCSEYAGSSPETRGEVRGFANLDRQLRSIHRHLHAQNCLQIARVATWWGYSSRERTAPNSTAATTPMTIKATARLGTPSRPPVA